MKILMYFGILLFILGFVVIFFDYSSFNVTGGEILIFIGLLMAMVSAKFIKK